MFLRSNLIILRLALQQFGIFQLLQSIESPLGLEQLRVAFRLYGIGIGMGIVAFIAEEVVHKLQSKSKSVTPHSAWQK